MGILPSNWKACRVLSQVKVLAKLGFMFESLYKGEIRTWICGWVLSRLVAVFSLHLLPWSCLDPAQQPSLALPSQLKATQRHRRASLPLVPKLPSAPAHLPPLPPLQPVLAQPTQPPPLQGAVQLVPLGGLSPLASLPQLLQSFSFLSCWGISLEQQVPAWQGWLGWALPPSPWPCQGYLPSCKA